MYMYRHSQGRPSLATCVILQIWGCLLAALQHSLAVNTASRHRKVGGVKNRDCRFQAELCMQQAAENCEQHRAAFEAFPGSLRIHIYVEELGQLSLENSLDSNREFEKGCKSYRSPCEACMYIVCMYLQVSSSLSY